MPYFDLFCLNECFYMLCLYVFLLHIYITCANTVQFWSGFFTLCLAVLRSLVMLPQAADGDVKC